MGRKTGIATRPEARMIDALKDLQKARTYLEDALEGYEDTGQIEGLLLALRDVTKAQGGVVKNPAASCGAF